MKRKISTVILDMDGVIFDTEAITQEAWLRALIQENYEATEEMYLELVGLNSRSEERRMKDWFGESFPYEKIHEMEQRFVDDIVSLHGLPTKEGVSAFLDLADELKLKKAVASSTEKTRVMQRLTVAGLHSRFDVIIGGDEVDRGKPRPDIFLEVARRLRVSAQECLVLEDSNAGIQAASEAEMLPIMIPDLQAPSDESLAHAIAILSTLTEVVERFEEYFEPTAI